MTEAPEMQAEMLLPTRDLTADMQFFTRKLGFRLDTIFPADNPAVAVISGHGVRLRLQRGAPVPPGTLRILAHDPASCTIRIGTRKCPEVISLRHPIPEPVDNHGNCT